jgi:pSer/pThr/pTyr-binding forkhead associated (FHA) protein
VLEDLDSKTGTVLRGNKVTQPAPMSDGDELRVGSVCLTLRVFSLPGSTETADDS